MKFRGYRGFALPTILIVSVILMSVLVVASVSVAGVRSNMAAQYYNQMAQFASESGTAYAKACIEKNGGLAQWSDSAPLKPYTDCSGTALIPCPDTSTDPACYVNINGNVRSTFSVKYPTVDYLGRYTTLESNGSVNLLRKSNNAIWRTYSHSPVVQLMKADVVNDGLVLELDASNPESYYGVGTSWNDLSGYSNNGALLGATYSRSAGGIFTFDGVNDRVDINNNSIFNTTNAITINLWVKWDASATKEIIVKSNNTNNGVGPYELFQSSNRVAFRTTKGGTSLILTSNTSINSDIWTNITATWDGTTKRIYINCTQDANTQSVAGPIDTSTGKLVIGAYGDGQYPFAGQVGYVAIYSRALSLSEIKNNYNAISPKYESANNATAKVLVIGGGGAGGGSATSSGGAGGGGAGGFLYKTGLKLNTEMPYSVIVGKGGASVSGALRGNNGGSSSFANLIAYGGGGGGAGAGTLHTGLDTAAGFTGSGGGAGYNSYALSTPGYGTSGQGYNGGQNGAPSYAGGGGGGGGGGVGGVGSVGHCGGTPGSGKSFDISGTSVTYARGGYGGGCTVIYNGNANTGNGGGGVYGSTTGVSGAGGSGIVIISYPTGNILATGGNITYSGGYTIHTFKTSGTFTVQSIAS